MWFLVRNESNQKSWAWMNSHNDRNYELSLLSWNFYLAIDKYELAEIKSITLGGSFMIAFRLCIGTYLDISYLVSRILIKWHPFLMSWLSASDIFHRCPIPSNQIKENMEAGKSFYFPQLGAPTEKPRFFLLFRPMFGLLFKEEQRGQEMKAEMKVEMKAKMVKKCEISS